MKTPWQFLLTSFALFWATHLAAQVNIQVALTPPHSPYFSDYENQMIMTLTNTSAQTVQVKLKGDITNQDNNNYVRTSPQYQPAQPIVLQPNEVKTLFANQGNTGFLDKNNIETSYGLVEKATILATGMIPEGVYDVCVQALDYATSAPLSQSTCQVISVGYPAPPTPILPNCGDSVTVALPLFGWLPPVGNFPNASLVYDLFVVKVPDGIDPNDAMLFAVNGNNIQDLWQINNIPTTSYVYQPFDAPLVHNQKYVWAVRVRDQNNSVNFQNQGLSQICTFIYKDPSVQDDDGYTLPPLPTACKSACEVDVSGMIWDRPVLTQYDSVKIGDFTMKIISSTADTSKKYSRLSGTGLIAVPFINNRFFRLRVQFDTIVLSVDKRVLSGSAHAMNNPNFTTDLLPDFDSPQWSGQTLSQTTLTTIDDYLKNIWANAGNAVDTIGNTYGWDMPFGATVNGYTLAATQVWFHPNYATLDAMAIVPLPNYTPSVTRLGLGVGDLCLNSKKFCQEGKMFLAADFGIDLDTKNAGMELVFKGSTPNSTDKTGTYMLFDTSGVKHIHIDARYNFPKNKIVRADGAPTNVQAQLTMRADNVLDWMFMAKMDSFHIAGHNDFTFYADSMYVDLSDSINPVLPDTITFMDINSDLAWKGFYAKKIAVGFAHGLTAKPTIIEIQNMILDTTGVTANINALNIIDINQGKIGTFNFTVDTIQVNIFKNSFLYGKLSGAMHLNIAAGDYNFGLIDMTPRTRKNLIPYSALISYMPPGDLDNDGIIDSARLNYNFVMQPKDSLEVPIWMLGLKLDSTSIVQVTNQNGAFFAQAMLNGTFGFTVKALAGVGTIDCAGVQFQGMGVTSNAPYFSMGNLQMKLASPQKKIGGFPVSFNSFDFVQKSSAKGPLYGFQIGVSVKIADSLGMIPQASGKFSFFGRLDVQNGQVQPVFDHASLDEVCVKGKISAIEFDGCVTFFENDPKFGNGLRGALQVTFPPQMKVGATVQFGHVNNYNYWYADALLTMPSGAGVPLFAGVEAYGFGGGAYYHMERKNVPNFDMNSMAQNASGIGMTPSGVVYEPNKQIAIGLKAKVFIGLTDRKVFNGSVALEVAFKNNGLDKILLDGDAQFMTNSEMKNAAVTGTLKAGYDHTQGLFFTNVNANMSYGNVGGQALIAASGTLDVHFQKSAATNNQLKWHVRFGRAPGVNQGQPINVNLAGLVNVQTYFQTGNFQIDPMPAPPAFVANLAGIGNKMQSATQRSGMTLDSNAISIIHGGRAGANIEKEFLIFYGKLQLGLGYDMLLTQNPIGCDAYPKPGIAGWYATGQAYAGILGEIGLNVEMFGTKARYTIAEVGAAALLQAGFVNPTWAEGDVGGQYNLFDGLISGSFHYEFELGDKCRPATTNALDKVDIIADVLPANGSTNAEVTATPSVATAIPMNKNKIIDLVQKYDDGTSRHRLFRFDESMIKTEVRRNNILMPVDSFERITSLDDYSFLLLPKTTLWKQTPYTFKVTVNIQECKAANVSYNPTTKLSTCTGGDASWELAKKNNQIWKEERTISFKTNNGLKTINEDMVEYTTPYQMSRMHIQSEGGQPKIVLSQNFEPASYQFPANAVMSYEARFIPLSNNSPMVKVEVPNIQGKKEITFNYPTTLSKGTYYAIQLIAKWTKAPTPQQPNPKQNFTDLVNKSSMNYQAVTYAVVKSRLLNENKLAVVGNEMKLYEIRFRTSQYNDYMHKLDNTVTRQVVYKVKRPTGNSRVSITVSEANLASQTQTITAINTFLGQSASYKPTISYTEEIRQRGPERFDYYDLYPYTKLMYGGKYIYRPAKLKYETPDAMAFHTKLTDKLVKALQIVKAKKDSEVESGLSLGFDNKVTGSPTIKLTWEEGLTLSAPLFVPDFVDPDDFIMVQEHPNTTVGGPFNGKNLIHFKSTWLGLEDVGAGNNPHVYTGNFMNGNNYQPQARQDFENIGAAMDIVEEETRLLHASNLTPKPTVKSVSGATNNTPGGN
ncbi:MAG: hypothetical protein JNL70_11460 [Saprospiraceae bacterium]|nr:hypothetical protein [Saprospiraceae bacterium]